MSAASLLFVKHSNDGTLFLSQLGGGFASLNNGIPLCRNLRCFGTARFSFMSDGATRLLGAMRVSLACHMGSAKEIPVITASCFSLKPDFISVLLWQAIHYWLLQRRLPWHHKSLLCKADHSYSNNIYMNELRNVRT